MAQYFTIHPDNPQGRLISQAAAILLKDGVAAYPTDSCYALGCLATSKPAVERIIRLRRLDPRHHLTLLCRDMSEISGLAKLDNSSFRLIKSLTPGPYTFLLKATREVPRRLQHPQKKTIGLRIPDNPVILALLENLGQPLLSTSLILPDEQDPETDPIEINHKLGKLIDLVMDGGASGRDATTVIDLSSGRPEIVRHGKGETSRIMAGALSR